MKLRAFSIAVIVFVFWPIPFSQPHPRKQSPPGASNQLKAIEQGLARAYVKGDRSFVDSVLADDWKVTDAAGRVLDKTQVLRETFEDRDRQIEALRIDQVKVRIYGDSAIVTGRSWAKGTYQGKSMSVTFLFTDVFVRRKGEWKVVASQATMLPPQ